MNTLTPQQRYSQTEKGKQARARASAKDKQTKKGRQALREAQARYRTKKETQS